LTLTTELVNPDTAIVRLFNPIECPRVQVPTAVDGALDFVGALASEPPPALTVTVTGTPLIGFPSRSFTTNAGDVASGKPADGLPLGCVVISMEAGVGPGAEESPQAINPRVRAANSTARIFLT
jgi:hypothetical protein